MSHFSAPCKSYHTSPVVSCSPDLDVSAAYRLMSEHEIGSVPVVSNEKLVGLLSRTDLLRIGTRQAGSSQEASVLTFPHQNVEKLMTPDVITVGESDSLQQAAKKMIEHRIHRVFMVDAQDRPVGVVSTRDLMLAVRDQKLSRPVSDFMASPVYALDVKDPVSEAVAALDRAHVSGLVVLDHGWAVGVFTQRDALLFRTVPRSTPTEEVMDPAIVVLPPSTSMHRAAAQAAAMKVRRILVSDGPSAIDVLSGLTFAQALLS